MAEHDGRERQIPGESCPSEAYVDAVPGRPQQVPAVTEGIGGQGDDVLALYEQIHEVMRNVIANCDWHQRQCKAARDRKRFAVSSGDSAHDGADPVEGAKKYQP